VKENSDRLLLLRNGSNLTDFEPSAWNRCYAWCRRPMQLFDIVAFMANTAAAFSLFIFYCMYSYVFFRKAAIFDSEWLTIRPSPIKPFTGCIPEEQLSTRHASWVELKSWREVLAASCAIMKQCQAMPGNAAAPSLRCVPKGPPYMSQWHALMSLSMCAWQWVVCHASLSQDGYILYVCMCVCVCVYVLVCEVECVLFFGRRSLQALSTEVL